MSHISSEQIERWRSHAMDAQETLAVSDHLAGCAECAERFAQAAPPRRVALGTTDEHVTGDQLVALVDDTMPPDERDAAMAHIATCAKCADELVDLRRFAQA